MPLLPTDPAAVRAAYERQLALLVPVVDGLRDEASGPGPLLDDAWRGPAADAAHEALRDLREGLRVAADAVDDEVRRVRHQLGDLR